MVKEKSPLLRKHRKLKFFLVLFIILIILLAYFFWYFSRRAKQNAVFPDIRNTDVYHVLAQFGLSDAVVDITDERIVVSYNLEDLMQKDEALFLTLGAAYQISPGSREITVIPFYELAPIEEVHVLMSDVQLFAEDKLPEKEFIQKMEIKKVG